MFHCWWCSTKVKNIVVTFIFILPFLSFYVHATISKFHPTFFIVNNVISWNDNKLVFYAWLGLCGVTIKCPFTLVLTFDGKNQKHWSVMCNIGWPSHHHVHAHWTKWKHWSLHDSWEKQDHWKLHPTFTRWFMDLIFLDLLFPSWYASWLSTHYCCSSMLCIF